MSKAKLNIFHIASEVEPFSKTGGLASVVGALPKAQQALGHRPAIVTPFYRGIIDRQKFKIEAIGEEEILINERSYKAEYFRAFLNSGLPVYFIGQKKFFGPREKIYGARNENGRFFFFNLAVLALLKKLDIQPDVIQCHDWQAGLIPYFLKGRFRADRFWRKTATLFTIHNLAYQFGHDWWTVAPARRDDGRSALPFLHNSKLVETVNFAKRAILSADAINTVSETYRQEILTKNFGEDLQRILKNREERVFGIVNGIDYQDYNPATDPGLFQNYDLHSIEKKAGNKKWLQQFLKLKVDSDQPLLCMTSRIVEQKGFQLFLEIASYLLKLDLEIVVMGAGDRNLVAALNKLSRRFPRKFVFMPFNGKYETSLYAGADIFLLPSRFEPCGVNQMIALRYGCIPVVHHIGGLADTVVNFNPTSGSGNGFVFKEYTNFGLIAALVRALETYKYRPVWRNLVTSGMSKANSWEIPAKKYIELYRTIIRLKDKNNNH